jgi:hypothetical protein
VRFSRLTNIHTHTQKRALTLASAVPVLLDSSKAPFHGSVNPADVLLMPKVRVMHMHACSIVLHVCTYAYRSCDWNPAYYAASPAHVTNITGFLKLTKTCTHKLVGRVKQRNNHWSKSPHMSRARAHMHPLTHVLHDHRLSMSQVWVCCRRGQAHLRNCFPMVEMMKQRRHPRQ